MLELALHLLDILENAVRAKAAIIRVSIRLDARGERLTLCVEDDGPGFPVAPEDVLNPFFTTKGGKRTGLGLSLFRAAAQQAGGDMALSTSEFGGAKVEAFLGYTHVDRAPLGDVGETVKAIAVPNPEIVWIVHVEGPGGVRTLTLQDFMLETPQDSLFRIGERYAEAIRNALREAHIHTG